MRAGKDNLAIPFRVEGQTELDLRRLLKKTVQQGRSSLVLALKRVAWLILDCARRTSTFRACAFREQEDDQATLPYLFQHPATEET